MARPNLFAIALSLRLRLLLSHLIVMFCSAEAILIVSSVFSTNLKDEIVAVIVGLISVVAMSVVTSRIILHPLYRIQKVAQSFAAGDLTARVRDSRIPEIHRLGVSFNHMAASLQNVEERRRELMGDVAHELRSPITVIHGYLEMINAGMTTLTPTIQSQMTAETERLIRLVNDLLELSKLEDGYLPLHRESFAIAPILKGLVTSFAAAGLQANCELQLDIATELPLVYADCDRVKQILINLMSNAITHTPNGTVTVQAWAKGDQVWIAISDTGAGIAAADLPKVFDRFWRADPSRNAQTGGSGIGLAITKRLVELQGGQIEVTSELGQGSVFQFSVPVAQ